MFIHDDKKPVYMTGFLLEGSMHIVNTIELNLIEEASDSKESLCEVQLNQKNTEIFIRGKVLEQAIWVMDHRYLIYTTDEVFLAESLNIYLIDMNRGVLDKLWIVQSYNVDMSLTTSKFV